jgi:hypothetical protein
MEAALAWPSKYLAKDDPVLSAQVQRTAFYFAMGNDMSYAAERLKRSVGYLGYRHQGASTSLPRHCGRVVSQFF